MLEPDIGGLHDMWSYGLHHLRTRIQQPDLISAAFPGLGVTGLGSVTWKFCDYHQGYLITGTGDHANIPDRHFSVRIEIGRDASLKSMHKKIRYVLNKGLRARTEPVRASMPVDVCELLYA